MDPEVAEMMVEILAHLACGIFAGAAAYVPFVEQPARLSCGVNVALTEWRPSYKRGTAMQVPLALIGSILAFLSWWLAKDAEWLIGGIFFLSADNATLPVIVLSNLMLANHTL